VAHSDEQDLRPTAETREAFEWLSAHGSEAIEQSVTRMAREVRRIAPDCTALSLSVSRGELTFTVMVDRPGAALLDAMQYLDGGPCVEAIHSSQPVATSGLATDEDRWQLFAAAEATMGIRSTLSLPVLRGDEAVGGVNLYGSTPDAFDGRHEELAAACGAWAEGAVTNADLSFNSRLRAAATPDRLHQQAKINTAMGFVAARQGVDLATARERSHEAAARAGITEADFARFLLEAHNSLSG
jgi:GAF domain-containing protein